MAKGFTIDVKGLKETMKKAEELATEVKVNASKELNRFAGNVSLEAKNLVASNSSDMGLLLNSIQPKYSTPQTLESEVNVGVKYAPFIEFGTRKFAAAHVATLPQDWQAYAAQFKGQGEGTFAEFLENIMGWVKRHGIEDAAAYPIAIKIFRDGIKARPFLYPSVQNNLPELKKRMDNLI